MRAVLGTLLAIAVATQLAASAHKLEGGRPCAPPEARLSMGRAQGPVPSSHFESNAATGLTDLNAIQATVTPWKFDALFELPEVPEPSGLCYCPLTKTIFVVDDGNPPERQSGLYEIDLDGKLLRGIKLGTDLEGVTYCGANQLLYVADEKDETVHIVEPRDLKVQGSFTVSREYEGKEVLKAGGNGFEGIAWVSMNTRGGDCMPSSAGTGVLLLLNQDDPTCLVVVDLNGVRPQTTVDIEDYFMLPQRNSGELYWDDSALELWVVNSWLNTTEIIDGDAQVEMDTGSELPVKRWEVMPGMAQEGLTFDPQGRMWIGQDAGGVVRYVK